MRQLKITKNITNRETKSLELHFSELQKIKQLSVEEEGKMAAIASSSNKNHIAREAAIEALVLSNMRFVVSVAKKYQGLGLPLSDLISEGHIGNLKAARRFDPTKGFKFISYSVWWIRQSIISAINQTGRTIRIPQNKIVDESKLRQMNLQLTQQLERTPTIYELADALGFTLETVLSSLDASKRLSQLDAPLKQGEEGSATLSEIIESTGILRTDQVQEDESLKIDLDRVLCTLTPRDAQIIRLSFGIDNCGHGKKADGSMTLEEIGARFDLTRERVRQIREKALKQLKKMKETELLRQYAA
jgi:RNA polymerase primary sigma factor